MCGIGTVPTLTAKAAKTTSKNSSDEDNGMVVLRFY